MEGAKRRKQYASIEEYEMDTNRSSIPVTREKFREIPDENDGLSVKEREELTWRFLFLCRPDEYSRTSMMKELYALHNKGFEIVFILGDCNRFLMKEISALFEAALILQIPEEYFWKDDAKKFYITNFIGKRQKMAGKYIAGIGSGRLKQFPDGDIIVTTRDAVNDEELISFSQTHHPKLIFYLTSKEHSSRRKIGDTMFVGCKGVVPYTFNAHTVLGVNMADLDD